MKLCGVHVVLCIFIVLQVSNLIAFSEAKESCGKSAYNFEAVSYISHGKKLSIRDWPWAAALIQGIKYICGGTIGKQTIFYMY